MSLIANCHRGKAQRAFTAEEFNPTTDPPRPLTEEEKEKAVEQLVAELKITNH